MTLSVNTNALLHLKAIRIYIVLGSRNVSEKAYVLDIQSLNSNIKNNCRNFGRFKVVFSELRHMSL